MSLASKAYYSFRRYLHRTKRLLYNLKRRLTKQKFTVNKVLLHYYNTTFNKRKPTVIAIELTNNCQASCTMCGHEFMQRKRLYMNFNLFKKTVDDAIANGITTYQLSFYGEPMLYPQLADAVSYIKSRVPKAIITINTNAHYMPKEKAKQLLDAGLNLIGISIDGNDKQEFEKIRVGLKWESVRQNVIDLHELITENKYNAVVEIKGLHTKGIPIDVENYKKTWAPYANKVTVRKDHELTSKTKDSFLNRVFPCNKIFNQFIVMANGDVTICAYDWEGKMKYGNIKNNSIKQLWGAFKLKQLRALHRLGLKNTIDFCKTCTYRPYKQ